MEEKKQPRIKILVACHKADPNIRQDDIYMPIQVGKALHPDLDLGFQCDNTGDNISEKNGSYCELTALYWAWKNLKDVDYIGLCHYRRYFNLNSKNKAVGILSPKDILHFDGLNIKYNLLKENNVIIPCFWSTPHSIWRDFLSHVLSEDLYILYKIIEKNYPSYLKSFESYLLGNKRSGFNMFIMSKNNFDKYCDFLFTILSKMEKITKLSDYISYKRLFGYIGEILLPVYCLNEGLNILNKPLLFVSDNNNTRNIPCKQFIKDIIADISFTFGNILNKKSLKDDYWEMYLSMDKIII